MATDAERWRFMADNRLTLHTSGERYMVHWYRSQGPPTRVKSPRNRVNYNCGLDLSSENRCGLVGSRGCSISELSAGIESPAIRCPSNRQPAGVVSACANPRERKASANGLRSRDNRDCGSAQLSKGIATPATGLAGRGNTATVSSHGRSGLIVLRIHKAATAGS